MLSDDEIAVNLIASLPEYLDSFLGSSIPGAAQANAEVIDTYRGKLPSYLLDLWADVGFAGFADGGLWLTNPDDYRDHLNWWLKDTPLPKLDSYHVIARGPFGDLVVWAERSGDNFPINVPKGLFTTVIDRLKSGAQPELETLRAYRSLLRVYRPLASGAALPRLDLEAADGTSLFAKCVQRHGPLTDRKQVYGFAPYLFMGGQPDSNNVQPVDEFVQLDLIKDFLDKPFFKDISTFPG